MREETKTFFQIAGIVVALGILIAGILTSNASEAFKYSAILSLFLIFLVIYIQTVITKRITSLEEKLEEKK